MTTSLLGDAFAHHIWATERLIDACAALTPEQLRTPAPGTYGSIIDTFRHLVRSDSWYLSFFRDEPTAPIDEKAEMGLAELRSVMTRNGTAWMELLAGETRRRRGRGGARGRLGGPRAGGPPPRAGHPARHGSPQPDLHRPDEPRRDAARDRPVELR